MEKYMNDTSVGFIGFGGLGIQSGGLGIQSGGLGLKKLECESYAAFLFPGAEIGRGWCSNGLASKSRVPIPSPKSSSLSRCRGLVGFGGLRCIV